MNNKETQEDYISRINNVIMFITNNIQEDLNIEILAEIACFSPFHFHRIFSAVVGETVNSFIQRVRLEKIGSVIINHKSKSLTEIAFKYGFNSNANFSRSFKKHYGVTPSQFKKMTADKHNKVNVIDKTKGVEGISFEKYFKNVEFLKQWIDDHATVSVKQMPSKEVAYVLHIGPFHEIGKAYQKLFKWAGPQGLVNENTQVLSIYYDDPKVTAEENLRQAACITITRPVELAGEVCKTTLTKGKYAVGEFEIDLHGFKNSWQSMFIWIAENGYRVSDLNYYHIYKSNPHEAPNGIFKVELCIPVE
jgi:AraC family transcriptional regulator